MESAEDNSKIIIIISENLKYVIIEYCTSLQKKLTNSEIVYYPSNNIENNENNKYIYIGLHYCNYNYLNKQNVYFINIEQLTMNGKNSSVNLLEPVINFMNTNNCIHLCDYSEGNISILNQYNIKSMYVPYQVNNDEIFNYEKIYNFAVCCSWNSRIEFIYNQITTKYDLCNSIGNPTRYGDDRDNILFRTKVLANIHHREFDYNILEEIRITRCILNKVIVVSEYSVEYKKYPLAKYVIFTDYNNMAEKIDDVIKNYDIYHEKIYNNFNIDEINDELMKYLEFLSF